MSVHLFVVHFPVALIITGALLDLVGIGMGDRLWRDWASRFLLLGATAALLAFVTAEGARLIAVQSSINFERLEIHQQWGSVGTVALIGCALLRTFWRSRYSGLHGWLNLAAIVVASVVVISITLSGSRVRHG